MTCLLSGASYFIGLYSRKFIKPYGQRAPHSQEKCGWRKVMVEMENEAPKCKGKYYVSLCILEPHLAISTITFLHPHFS